MSTDELGPAAPTPAIDIDGGAEHAGVRLDARSVVVPDAVVAELEATGAQLSRDLQARSESSRDWWPLAMIWATEGRVPARADVLVRVHDTEQVSAVMALADRHGIPVTVAAGRSGVCGGSVPVRGGIVLDLTPMTGIVEVDDDSLLVRVRPGTFGDHFEAELGSRHQLTVGHWPQSMALSTVGGWVACRGAGQLSGRYGKIEDLVVGLEVVLADGRVIHTGGHPRAAAGPDLTQLFVGSEGTLGVVTEVLLRARPTPTHEARGAWGFDSFEAGLDACRRMLRRGASPAVLRLYDVIESQRNFELDTNVLLVLDEGDSLMVDAVMAVVAEETDGAESLDVDLVESWMGHRNNVDALESLISGGLVVDTMEVAAPWGDLDAVFAEALAAIRAVDGTLQASAHQSHAYTDGACLYFTFAGKTEPEGRESYYRAVWDAGTRAVLANGGALSHHHGIGLNRGRFMAEALGTGFDVLVGVKDTLDPNGICNPGKLGLPDPFGASEWP
ncbi:MAG: FAD-binding oxidoreductase [Acidimicrobiales bacterium]